MKLKNIPWGTIAFVICVTAFVILGAYGVNKQADKCNGPGSLDKEDAEFCNQFHPPESPKNCIRSNITGLWVCPR